MANLPRPVPPLLVLDACCAINLLASARESAILATDDAKALRILTGEPYRLEVVGTPWMIEHWSRTGVSPSEVREAILRIQEVGRFLPPKRDPLREWWRAMAGE